MLGGSADLTPSNNTKAKHQLEIRPGGYKGSYVHYGVREHGMAAAMNGIALHGGLIPYGGTFMLFLGLLPAVDPAGGDDGNPNDLCDDA